MRVWVRRIWRRVCWLIRRDDEPRVAVCYGVVMWRMEGGRGKGEGTGGVGEKGRV